MGCGWRSGGAVNLMARWFWDTYIDAAYALLPSDEFGVAALRSAVGYARMPTAV